MKIPYYPGCTLSTVASDFDRSARQSIRDLGVELEELPKWNCCGASFPLTPENVIGLAGPGNVLIQAMKAGWTVSTLCSFCYNTLRRTNNALKSDAGRRDVLASFLETDGLGDVKVLHLLEVLRDQVGFAGLKAKVARPLKGLKVAAYYGCMLLRPADAAIDHPESPKIFEDFLSALGATPVDWPNRGECCGSHLAMSETDLVRRLSGSILSSAQSCGADLLTTSCPLCWHNLVRSQEAILRDEGKETVLPVIYFTQILGLALGGDPETLGIANGVMGAEAVLKAKGLWPAAAAAANSGRSA